MKATKLSRKTLFLCIGIGAGALILIAAAILLFTGVFNTDKPEPVPTTEQETAEIAPEELEETEAEPEEETGESVKETTAGVQTEDYDNEEETSGKKSKKSSKTTTTSAQNFNIVIPGYTEIVLPSGTKTAEVELENPSENGTTYDLSFSLRIKETDEVLFTTGYADAGKAIEEVELNSYLIPGTYDAILTVQPRRSDGSLTDKAEIELILYVE